MNIFDKQIEQQHEAQLKAYKELVKSQEEKICELATKLAYARRTIENITVEEPKKEEEPQYLYVYNHTTETKTCMSLLLIHETYGWHYMGKVKVEK